MSVNFETKQGTVQGRPKRIPEVTLRLEDSRSLLIGPDDNEETMVEPPWRSDEDYGTPTRMVTGDKRIPIEGGHNTAGRIFVRTRDPLPLTIQGIIPKVVAR
jgi:hypothetical protein